MKDNANFTPAENHKLSDLVEYSKSSVVSRTIHNSAGATMTVFAFDKGQELSEHTAPFDAFVQVLDGEVELIIGGKPVKTAQGEITLMPANVPHAVKCQVPFKMLLTMIKQIGS